MKILRWILLSLAGIVALILIVSIFLPKEVEIVSETEINLPVNKVYYSLSTFADREKWDPWVKEDSTVTIEVTPAAGIVGTKYSWTSISSASGEMVIDSVVPNQYISYALTFDGMNEKPKVWNRLTDKEGKTILSWGFSQKNSYPAGRIFMAIMKGKLQKDYDRGLADLKIWLEENGVAMSSLSDILIEEVPGFNAIVAEGTGGINELSARMAELYQSLTAEIINQDLVIAGVPFHHFKYFDKATGITYFELGFPVIKPGKSTNNIKAVSYKGFTALEAVHTGPYSEFGTSYTKFMKYIKENNINVSMDAWEFYLVGPETSPDETSWKTLIAFPIKK